MLEALAAGLLVFAVSFAGLMLVEKLIHKLTKNPDQSYRWGVWLFSILLGLWGFLTSIGRS
jgi:hypothetical protein